MGTLRGDVCVSVYEGEEAIRGRQGGERERRTDRDHKELKGQERKSSRERIKM